MISVKEGGTPLTDACQAIQGHAHGVSGDGGVDGALRHARPCRCGKRRRSRGRFERAREQAISMWMSQVFEGLNRVVRKRRQLPQASKRPCSSMRMRMSLWGWRGPGGVLVKLNGVVS